MRQVAVIEAKRTPVGKIPGLLSTISDVELLAYIFKHIASGRKTVQIDEAIAGSAFSVERDNLCRRALIKAGLPTRIPAFTISKTCASSDEALAVAFDRIINKRANTILVGGCEKVNNSSYVLHHLKNNLKKAIKGQIQLFDDIKDQIEENDMAHINELLSRAYGITRKEQDDYVISSINRAVAAQEKGYFHDEMLPVVSLADGVELNKDELLTLERTKEVVRAAEPIFLKDGFITQYNAAPTCDCAAGMLLMDWEKAMSEGVKPLAVIRDTLSMGVSSKIPGQAMSACLKKIIEKNGMGIKEVDLFEINESFAAQAIYTTNSLGINKAHVNVNGGNLALGYPIGTTGLRMMVTLIHEMRRRMVFSGVSVMCAGGYLANAVLMENVQEGVIHR